MASTSKILDQLGCKAANEVTELHLELEVDPFGAPQLRRSSMPGSEPQLGNELTHILGLAGSKQNTPMD